MQQTHMVWTELIDNMAIQYAVCMFVVHFDAQKSAHSIVCIDTKGLVLYLAKCVRGINSRLKQLGRDSEAVSWGSGNQIKVKGSEKNMGGSTSGAQIVAYKAQEWPQRRETSIESLYCSQQNKEENVESFQHCGK